MNPVDKIINDLTRAIRKINGMVLDYWIKEIKEINKEIKRALEDCEK
jgi:hypothetical protein